MRFLLALLLWASCAFSAIAQTVVKTQPLAVNSSNSSSTIAVTNTFQSIWSQSTTQRGRAGCTIVNYGTNTMWVYFGAIANATKANSIQLAANQPVYCQVFGTVLQDQVSITGTSGDAFFAAQQ